MPSRPASWRSSFERFFVKRFHRMKLLTVVRVTIFCWQFNGVLLSSPLCGQIYTLPPFFWGGGRLTTFNGRSLHTVVYLGVCTACFCVNGDFSVFLTVTGRRRIPLCCCAMGATTVRRKVALPVSAHCRVRFEEVTGFWFVWPCTA